jgi:competence protein ComEC
MKNRIITIVLFMLLISILILGGCESEFVSEDNLEDNLLIHFIDVGQGDSTLIIFPNKEVALIDAGTIARRKEVVEYIEKQNIKRIDYLIGTHPHEDHIGGLPEIIRSFEIGKIYLPNKTNNTAIFEELLNEIKNHNLKITEGKAGLNIIDHRDLGFTIIAPSLEYNSINDSSIVTKIVYKDFSTIITGDAEKESESNMVKEEYNLKANILRIGHHGSSTSTTEEFLNKVNPDYAVISLGKDNTYGHPHREIIEALEGRNIITLRTDILGNIVFKTDGKNIELINDVNLDKSNKNDENIYIGNINSKIFHIDNCSHLPKKANQILLKGKENALKQGYKPHSICVE